MSEVPRPVRRSAARPRLRPVALTLGSIHRYPVKSCRGESLASAVVEPWGLAGDRRWMVVDEDGTFVTARSAQKLLTVRADLTADGLRLSAPGRAVLDVARPGAATAGRVAVRLWTSALDLAAAGAEADAWFSGLLGRPVRLVHLDDPTARRTDPTFTGPADRVSLADGYPLLLTTTASLRALDELVAGAAVDGAAPAPLPMHRFRPNVVVEGAQPWVEDTWRVLRVGDVTFRMVKACGRCVMTTLEPDHATGDVAKGKEPLQTLARTRRTGKGVLFGVNLVPVLTAGEPAPTIEVGAPVEVLESVAPGTRPVGH